MDISDLQVLQEKCAKLEKEAARYKAILETTSELISVTTFSPDLVYTYVSPSHIIVLGYKPEELLGKSGLDLVHPADKMRYMPLILKYVAEKAGQLLTGRPGGIVEKVDYRFRDKQGNYRFIESTVNLMQDEILFISHDVTERKLAEERFQQKVKELEDFQELAVGRELKMMELEKEIDQLKAIIQAKQ